ncbi:MAG: hypothetical protein SV775_15310, partial [Thermodesulfobacteriota bacterium]|nr:hypothetical protein [Thermodesulfobacteriota bacterium]
CMETANRDIQAWLEKKEKRIHGTTHEVVCLRFAREAPHLKALPRQAFDTSYRVYRKVHKDCTVRFESNSYVVPHTLVAKEIILRVKDGMMRIFSDNALIVSYEIPEGKGHLVQDKRFYEALRKDHEMNRRKYNHAKRPKGRAKHTISPLKSPYDMDVEIRPMAIYDHAAGEVRR